MYKRKLLYVIRLTSILFLLGLLCFIIFCSIKSDDKCKDTEYIETQTKDKEVFETEDIETENTETESIKTESIETESIEVEVTEIEEIEIIEPEPIEVSDETFVRVKTYIPNIKIELKYAETDNFTGQKIYEFTDAYLRYGTVKKLMKVQASLREQNLSLKIWDAFRPVSAQFVLWEICPDSTYVANPYKGFSSHSRGNTVDITIVDMFAKELTMPTGFDDFSKLADRDYSDCTEEAKKNALLLETLMIQNGFKAYSGEWWHFTDEVSYPVDEVFQP